MADLSLKKRCLNLGHSRAITYKKADRADGVAAQSLLRGKPKPVDWPKTDRRALDRVLESEFSLYDLWDCSPVRITAEKPATEEIIDTLFPGKPLLCCGWNLWRWDTKPRESWRGALSRIQFLVPSPMRAMQGVTLEGNISCRTLDNVGDRRFLVVEFDLTEPLGDASYQDASAALHLHLGQHAPLTLVVDSGGKSLHGWYYCAGQSEATVLRFMRYAVSLGADPMTWVRSQPIRMPDGLRDNGRRHTVYFFNPKQIK